MEKLIRILKQEKEEVTKDKIDLQEKLKLQEKDLNYALTQTESATKEYKIVSDKLSELRQQKQKLSRQVKILRVVNFHIFIHILFMNNTCTSFIS